MSDTAARLVDDFLPRAPYRQWVMSFPWPMRFRLAMDRNFLYRMLRAFLHEVFSFYRRRGRDLGIASAQPAIAACCLHLPNGRGRLRVLMILQIPSTAP